MSKIKNSSLEDQYGAEPFEQQQFVTADAEGVKNFSVVCQNNVTVRHTCLSYVYEIFVDHILSTLLDSVHARLVNKENRTISKLPSPNPVGYGEQLPLGTFSGVSN